MARDAIKIRTRMKAYNSQPEVMNRANARQQAARMTVKGRAEQLVRAARHRAKKEKRSFNIDVATVEKLITETICPYTLQPFVLVGGRSPWAPSIDRLDNDGGYTQDNVQIVSFWWNVAKNKWPEEVIATALMGLKIALAGMEFAPVTE